MKLLIIYIYIFFIIEGNIAELLYFDMIYFNLFFKKFRAFISN
jgi:hypothetical protein